MDKLECTIIEFIFVGWIKHPRIFLLKSTFQGQILTDHPWHIYLQEDVGDAGGEEKDPGDNSQDLIGHFQVLDGKNGFGRELHDNIDSWDG